MRQLACPVCGKRVYFENFACLSCGAALAFSANEMAMKALASEPAPHTCANRSTMVCNWSSDDGAPICFSCRLDGVIPNLSMPGNSGRWRKIEQAKRRVIVDLLRLGLPIVTRAEDFARGLSFKFLSNELALQPVLTGHNDGVITLDIAEADDSERENRRNAMGEPYRTLVGHFRHEIAHYYWSLMIEASSDIGGFRAIFGDERDDYDHVLKRHYDQGPPADWNAHFISAYASSHPWEDWAETFAHFVHIVATMDTAIDFRIAGAARPPISDPYREPDFDALIAAFLPVTQGVNEINRSIGFPDIYPFLLTPAAIGKLHFVHMIVRKAAALQKTEAA